MKTEFVHEAEKQQIRDEELYDAWFDKVTGELYESFTDELNDFISDKQLKYRNIPDDVFERIIKKVLREY